MAGYPQLVLVFGATAIIQDSELTARFRKLYPTAHPSKVSSRRSVCMEAG